MYIENSVKLYFVLYLLIFTHTHILCDKNFFNIKYVYEFLRKTYY